uniref:Prolyl 4-hydroxylase alpha subunit Fe(2+) 2OG dioxygenase domain-containing protein n=1 Tax=Pyramimonas obovata TaxID=1411642 RepID=A0A7S0RJB2_9CHLO
MSLSHPTDYQGGGTRYDTCSPKGCPPLAPGMTDDRPLYRVPKGVMVVHGGRKFHEGVDVTGGSRYIVAGFIGLNRHCCALRYAGVYGLWQVSDIPNGVGLLAHMTMG